ncbi:hypothetical protein BCR33DRAFT_701480 [Rhizoclosmatium globosum]|uniref:DUF1349-domain-containing protein n=1 Tax=Rhizoclosmatium globosum TaxID=329046 RepID=A0A1Y2BPI2_9FUNG|nr:hypothetical protein BCR33DRAFT_701480 [Rhizoclosmatium globosum]|eukprot:ORY36663.1 hypothetical protein BCR33DRAFT_701480 [Rhizoclosmatium globosum]
MGELVEVTAQPSTDIWRKPPHTDIFNAPTSKQQHGSLSSFKSVRATFSGPWKEQFDQGGIVLSVSNSNSNSDSTSPKKWVKAGVELFNKVPRLGVVATDSWSDWSVAPVVDAASQSHFVSIELVKENLDGYGDSLWVYQVVDGVRLPLREVTWFFGPESDGATLSVAAYAARPNNKTEEDLVVQFKEFVVEWK